MEIREGTLDLSTGIATTVSGASKVSSTTIYDVSRRRNQAYDNFTLWSRIRGVLGGTGASVRITWEGCYTRSGVTYLTPTDTTHIRRAGTTVSGPEGDGCDAASFAPDMFPFMKIKAIHDTAATTNAAFVDYALITD